MAFTHTFIGVVLCHILIGPTRGAVNTPHCSTQLQGKDEDLITAPMSTKRVIFLHLREAQRITSSAKRSSAGGIGISSTWAVLRLMTSSNFMGCSTGSSAGLAPFKILSTYAAARRHRSAPLGP